MCVDLGAGDPHARARARDSGGDSGGGRDAGSAPAPGALVSCQ